MNTQLDHELKDALKEIVDRTPELGPTPDLMLAPAQHASSHWRSVALAAAVAALVVAGVAALSRPDNNGESPASATQPVTSTPSTDALPVTFVLDTLPAGLKLTATGLTGPVVRSQPSQFISYEFGSTNDPFDPARMIHLEYAPTDVSNLVCFSETDDRAITEVATFAVGDSTGRTCRWNGMLTANWELERDSVRFTALAGESVTATELVDVITSLGSQPADLAGNPQGPSVDIVTDQLPTGWSVLVAGDAPFHQQISEANWTATTDGVDDADTQLLVSTWTGLEDDYALLVRHPAVQAERVTIRGHDGYQYISTTTGANGPLEIEIWWTEQPGVVVSVTATDLGDLNMVNDLIDSLRPVDQQAATTVLGS